MKVCSSESIPIKLWTDSLDGEAWVQAKNLANLPFARHWIALMPDAHAGFGMPIGGVLATRGVIVPNAVGVDIGCGMCAAKSGLKGIDEPTLKQILGLIRQRVPVGFDHHPDDQPWPGGFEMAPDIPIIQRELSSARKQLGTLGGGNHFIEVQQDESGYIWLMVHSGSRNFGYKTAREYHKLAQRMCQQWHSKLPHPNLAFLPIETREGGEYYEAMKYCLDFARANRRLIIDRAISAFSEVTHYEMAPFLDVHHNYVAIEDHRGENLWVHRKGAVRARQTDMVIIPGSMGSPSYIAQGLGSTESFCSCSHGAGRRMGRSEAKKSLDLVEEQSKMSGIVHGFRTVDELDEAPGAYKDIDEVMEAQKDLVALLIKLRPLAVIKG